MCEIHDGWNFTVGNLIGFVVVVIDEAYEQNFNTYLLLGLLSVALKHEVVRIERSGGSTTTQRHHNSDAVCGWRRLIQ